MCRLLLNQEPKNQGSQKLQSFHILGIYLIELMKHTLEDLKRVKKTLTLSIFSISIAHHQWVQISRERKLLLHLSGWLELVVVLEFSNSIEKLGLPKLEAILPCMMWLLAISAPQPVTVSRLLILISVGPLVWSRATILVTFRHCGRSLNLLNLKHDSPLSLHSPFYGKYLNQR